MITDFDTVVPTEPGDAAMPLMHERSYIVRTLRKDDSTIVLRGAVQDRKPPHLYLATDPEPLTVHHMVIELEVTIPAMTITAARVDFETFPNDVCPDIAENYTQLVGLSIARGFTHKVRELFGGPRGCTHTSALLQAMAPVAIQSIWSMRVYDVRRREAAAAERGDDGPVLTDEEQAAARELSIRTSLNTCHVWDAEGPTIAKVRAGAFDGIPVFIRRRLSELGEDLNAWRRSM